MREINLKFFTIQAHKDKELDNHPVRLEVIRRFIRSSEFETPFGLRLLAFTLSEEIGKNEMSLLSLERSRKVEKDSAKNLSDSANSDNDEKGSNASSSVMMNSEEAESNSDDVNSEQSEDAMSISDTSFEDEELNQILGLADNSPCPARHSCPEEEENEETETTPVSEQQDSEAKSSKATTMPKKSKMTLLDCLSPQEDALEKESDVSGSEDVEAVTSGMVNDDIISSHFNKEAKNMILCNSEICTSDKSQSENEKRKVKKRKGKAAKSALARRKRKKNDLLNYRISSSEDDGDEEEKKSNKKRKEMETKEKEKEEFKTLCKTEKATEGTDDEEIDIISELENSLEIIAEHSNSECDVIQVDEVPVRSDPKKGRKNINKILDVKSLQTATRQALKMETERKRRLKEREARLKILNEGAGQGSKLVLDFDPETLKELVVVDENLSKHLKTHQREGVIFMWNCCFESLNRIEEEKGSGCILAHCMGLGKTFQVITLIHSALNHSPHLRTALIVCPFVTLRNWYHEFETWMTGCNNVIKPFDIGPANNRKYDEILRWMEEGGVLILSYETFRTLITHDKYLTYRNCLLDPGPDIVVCDEGHQIKNPKSGLSSCVSEIRTQRRIVLTGTPLQNNLNEYYSMVQFVKPNILGTKTEFLNRFVNPITNGQFENSTQEDVFIMKQRSHVLHSLLESFVQRLGYDILEPLLPEKQEYVVSVSLTETQKKLYTSCVKKPLRENRGLLWDFHWFHKIWTHPLVMRSYFEQNNVEYELREPLERFISEDEYHNIRSSNKLFLFFTLLQKCNRIGDKVLVFSQSLYTLGVIENFLLKLNADYEEGRLGEFGDSWVLGQDYFKLTGSIKPECREKFFKRFNSYRRARLFLISTKTGGLGINLVAANRVILFDASWNPAHDLQSIFRAYRLGQKKPCFVYRFLAYATMEEKIYERQVTKLSLAHRILDEHQIERHYSSENLQELYTFNPLPMEMWKVPKVPKDKIFAEVLSKNRDIIVGYHEHNSLLENKEEEELTEQERQAAWENYEMEKMKSQKFGLNLMEKPGSQKLGRNLMEKTSSQKFDVNIVDIISSKCGLNFVEGTSPQTFGRNFMENTSPQTFGGNFMEKTSPQTFGGKFIEKMSYQRLGRNFMGRTQSQKFGTNFYPGPSRQANENNSRFQKNSTQINEFGSRNRHENQRFPKLGWNQHLHGYLNIKGYDELGASFRLRADKVDKKINRTRPARGISTIFPRGGSQVSSRGNFFNEKYSETENSCKVKTHWWGNG